MKPNRLLFYILNLSTSKRKTQSPTTRRAPAQVQTANTIHASPQAATAAPAPAPGVVGVRGTQPAGPSKEVEYVREADDAGQPPAGILPGHRGGRHGAGGRDGRVRGAMRVGAGAGHCVGCDGGRRGDGYGGRRTVGRVDDPHAVGARGDEFGHRVRERRRLRDVEDGDRVLTVVHAAFRQDHGDEVDARRAEQWERGGLREKLKGLWSVCA